MTASPMPILDAHVHVWELARTPQPWIPPEAAPAIARDFSIDDLRAVTDGTGVEAAVLVQSINSVAETDALLGAAAAHPWLVGVVGWLDLQDPEAPELIDRRVAGPDGDWLCGVRHVFAADEARAFLRSPKVARGLRRLGERGLAFDLLLQSADLALAVEVAQRHPEVRFVLDHLAKPDVRAGEREPWRRNLLELGRCPNVWAKLSGLPGEADWGTWSADTLIPYLEIAWEAFGPDRLIFASDWPVCTVAGPYGEVVAAQCAFLESLLPDERRQVLWNNAQRAYGLRGVHAVSEPGPLRAERR